LNSDHSIPQLLYILSRSTITSGESDGWADIHGKDDDPRLVCSTCFGRDPDATDEYDVTDSNDPTGSPRIDIDTEGNFHLLYLLDDGGDWPELAYRKVGPTGSTLEGPVQVSPGNVDGQIFALALSVDPAMRVHIGFTVMTTSDDARDVYYAQVSSSGGVSVAAKNIYSSDVDANALDIESDSSGNAYIVWNEREDPPTIMWIKVSSSGSIASSAKEISDEPGVNGDLYFPRIGVHTGGKTSVAWQQKDNQLARISIYFTLLSATGSSLEDPVEVASNLVADLENLEATADSNDNLHLTYVQSGSIMWTVVEDDGGIRDSMEIASSLLGEDGVPDISIAPNDRTSPSLPTTTSTSATRNGITYSPPPGSPM